MIDITKCANRPGYYSIYEGQEKAIEEIKNKFPKYFLEDVPLKQPKFAWWNIYTDAQLKEFQALIDGAEVAIPVEEIEKEEVVRGGLSSQAAIEHLASETGCSASRSVVIAENEEYCLIKTPPIQGKKYVSSKVFKVSLYDLSYNQVWDCEVKPLGKNLKAELIQKELG